MLLENDGGCNVISVSVKVYRDGTVGFAHSRTDDESCYYAWPFYRWSEDGGESWSPHEPMVDMETEVGFPCNGRLMQLASGRLVLPFQLNTRPPTTREGESFVHAAHSDDAGRSWKLSNPVAVRGTTADGIARRGAGEPAAFERKDGSIMFLMRTRLGKIYAAESADGGETVSESYDTGLDSPAARQGGDVGRPDHAAGERRRLQRHLGQRQGVPRWHGGLRAQPDGAVLGGAGAGHGRRRAGLEQFQA
jgi:hypothetical protein